jgi:thioredoxin reductase
VQKEKLLEFWNDVADKTQLAMNFNERFEGLDKHPDGTYEVRTSRGSHHTRSVLLALGRRGTPRKLGVPGEELPKVVYRLVDAEQYAGRSVLVVGGGDSALEAANSLAEQPGTEVALSYRGEAFARVKEKNRLRLDEHVRAGRIRCMLKSKVLSIDPDNVQIVPDGEPTLLLRNHHVVVCAGGELPTPLLRSIGIRFETKFGKV